MRVPSRYLRPASQAAFFAGFALLFLGLQYPVSMPLSNLLLAVDPLAGISAIIFNRSAWMPDVLPVAAFLLGTLLLGRAFCGCACPVGFLSDVAARLRPRAGKSNRDRFGYLQFGVLAAVLLSSVFTLSVLSVLDPMVVFQRASYLVWAGAGIPAVLILMVAASPLIERFWCRALCPLGGMLGLVAVASPFGRRLNDHCNSCMKCHRACPMGAIAKNNRWDATACTKCLKCERVCPQDAISFAPSKPQSPAVSHSRRSFLAGVAALAALAASDAIASALTSRNALIRPPGSLVEEKFNAACVRCGSCIKACVGEVITPAGLDSGLERAFTPSLDFGRGICQRCGTCGQVCPTGAIISLPVDKVKIGTARIDTGLCWAWKNGYSCLVCDEVCPVRAIAGADRLRPKVKEDLCVGCGSCQHNCPVEEKAIRVYAEGERRRS
jgi:ferredoxin-type protein NapF